ncbi:37S ribosomal protein S9, mitochondrial [Emydomyces testavorans]|uniref:Small ribosomal subunit protein uS9m n=1 Tax=Emydomyces testavorans TaxID=2070801 RepID=A0AAF0DN88_9EURO|nr:37S ribosomal protein S9, mitochondrial [Emydomyces testavorans]
MAFRFRTASAKTSCLSPLSTPQKNSQKRPLSISSPRVSSNAALPIDNAAPPIDFNDENAIPARILPASPAYFSGMPKFVDRYLNLERLRSKYATLPTVPAGEAPRMAWLKLAQFRDMVEEDVPSSKYKKLVETLQRLSKIRPSLMPEEVKKATDEFLRPGNPHRPKPVPRKLDEIGRARAVGRRKASTATVWLVEGDGQVMINGRNIVHVFPRIHDRESALWALRTTSRMDKYNVWAMVHGGGVTGQAEAITLALARALLVHEPALKPMLRRAGVVTVDHRQVERKKPGRRKARKMPAWVKR